MRPAPAFWRAGNSSSRPPWPACRSPPATVSPRFVSMWLSRPLPPPLVHRQLRQLQLSRRRQPRLRMSRRGPACVSKSQRRRLHQPRLPMSRRGPASVSGSSRRRDLPRPRRRARRSMLRSRGCNGRRSARSPLRECASVKSNSTPTKTRADCARPPGAT